MEGANIFHESKIIERTKLLKPIVAKKMIKEINRKGAKTQGEFVFFAP